jgi:ubiquinone biosynthesis protein
VLRAMVADFLPLMREEGLTMPPDLLLIFKALVTLDGVLCGIQPDFDLSSALRRSALRIARARSRPSIGADLAGAALGTGQGGDDAPRLVRAAVRRLEAEPSGPEDGQAGLARPCAQRADGWRGHCGGRRAYRRGATHACPPLTQPSGKPLSHAAQPDAPLSR